MDEFDLIIVGTGSGNSIIGPEFDDWNIALVEKDVFGGTCLNRGCIPSKMFIYAADVVETVRHADRYGIDAQVNGVDWPAIVQRVFGRIDPIAAGGREYRLHDCPNVTVFEGEGRFVDHKVLEVDGRRVTAPHIVLGAGARPFVPPVIAGSGVPFHTSDDIMRIEGIPDRLLVVGGGYIASELAHVFDAMGSSVTMVNRSGRLLRAEDDDVSARFTEVMGRRFDLRLGAAIHGVGQDESGTVHLDLVVDGAEQTVSGDALLVATGRVPNGDILELDASGIAHDGWRVLVDDTGRTNVDGVWAFGDLANTYQLKHLANLEVKVLAHNLLHPDAPRHLDPSLTPHAVFGHPQVAAVGLAERDAVEQGLPHVVAHKDYGATAYGWAMEDTDSFVKLVVHRDTRRLLGAHYIGPQASTLIQQLVQGMALGSTVDEMATAAQYIHPALTEVTENALLEAISALDG